MKKLLLLTMCAMALKSNAQFYLGAGAGFSFTKSKPMAELQMGVADKNLVVQGGFLVHLDNKNPVLFQAQAGGRIYTGEEAATGWQLTAGYCYQHASNDHRKRNKKTYIISAQMFRPFGWGEWYVSTSYTPGYTTTSLGVRGIIDNLTR